MSDPVYSPLGKVLFCCDAGGFVGLIFWIYNPEHSILMYVTGIPAILIGCTFVRPYLNAWRYFCLETGEDPGYWLVVWSSKKSASEGFNFLVCLYVLGLPLTWFFGFFGGLGSALMQLLEGELDPDHGKALLCFAAILLLMPVAFCSYDPVTKAFTSFNINRFDLKGIAYGSAQAENIRQEEAARKKAASEERRAREKAAAEEADRQQRLVEAKRLLAAKEYPKGFSMIHRLANEEVVEAQCLVALSYQEGWGVAKNRVSRAYWFGRAAKNGHPKAMFLYGRTLQTGDGVTMDKTRALEFFRDSALAGYGPSMLDYGLAYAMGEGVPKDAAKAVEWLRKADAAGISQAADYIRGIRFSVSENTLRGRPPLPRLSNKDCPDPLRRAISAFRSGQYRQAMRPLWEYADQEYPQALFLLGWAYEWGLGGEQYNRSNGKSKYYYAKAASRGETNAAWRLGVVWLLEGDYKRAITCLFQAEKTMPEARFALGIAYARLGKVEEAVRAFESAAKADVVKAENALKSFTFNIELE